MENLAPVIPFNEQILDSLKQTLLDNFRPHLENQDAIFIDYPVHLNVGDLLIAEGTEALFRALNVNIVARISERNQERLFYRDISEDTVLILHGGGNFGDLYPHHQSLRERVIEAFPNNKVLIMPQSVHYQDPSQLTQKVPLFQSHNNLYMFVRDEHSFDVMSEAFDEAHLKLLPDMAFAMSDRWKGIVRTSEGTLSLRRRDIEATDTGEDGDRFDWDDLFKPFDERCYNIARRLARYENKLHLNLGLDAFWKWYSNHLIKRAVERFTSYSVVDTDRLHGMILSLLVGNDVVMRDNSYGKLRRYATCWLGLKLDETYAEDAKKAANE
ncbi:polysaccharide pyruvyl transferase family protein [Vibrio nigripulchritudo]|uniref:polysaccharide pyruvyl transferase family protein n=1 Tax=Vibrio nigripulchritudo TaxID=28173 RepID=UPI0005FA80FB|nr:polysaccharide pyruvyl transferase family protein [Vibrio nigripulchritudo]KJY75099.1 hypothetical protein TW74_17270 [Vibrio nigripulchritudo]